MFHATYLDFVITRTQVLILVSIPFIFLIFLIALYRWILAFLLLEQPLMDFGRFGPGFGSFHYDIVSLRMTDNRGQD
jgi:hypothetical protein